MDERDASAANPPAEDAGDDVNPPTGTGTSGPGGAAYEDESQTGDVGGEAEIDLEDKARRMAGGDPTADPALGADANRTRDEQAPSPNPDEVTENPEVQSGG